MFRCTTASSSGQLKDEGRDIPLTHTWSHIHTYEPGGFPVYRFADQLPPRISPLRFSTADISNRPRHRTHYFVVELDFAKTSSSRMF
uniref:Uncharacterized protein n=1 Tax=Timema monikensis TaxID=170555 RepID=A0A7R9EEE4_9NEOP|nr:unnamed protein product [Timema monikensis]